MKQIVIESEADISAGKPSWSRGRTRWFIEANNCGWSWWREGATRKVKILIYSWKHFAFSDRIQESFVAKLALESLEVKCKQVKKAEAKSNEALKGLIMTTAFSNKTLPTLPKIRRVCQQLSLSRTSFLGNQLMLIKQLNISRRHNMSVRWRAYKSCRDCQEYFCLMMSFHSRGEAIRARRN